MGVKHVEIMSKNISLHIQQLFPQLPGQFFMVSRDCSSKMSKNLVYKVILKWKISAIDTYVFKSGGNRLSLITNHLLFQKKISSLLIALGSVRSYFFQKLSILDFCNFPKLLTLFWGNFEFTQKVQASRYIGS